jgi:hypothetical protein
MKPVCEHCGTPHAQLPPAGVYCEYCSLDSATPGTSRNFGDAPSRSATTNVLASLEEVVTSSSSFNGREELPKHETFEERQKRYRKTLKQDDDDPARIEQLLRRHERGEGKPPSGFPARPLPGDALGRQRRVFGFYVLVRGAATRGRRDASRPVRR